MALYQNIHSWTTNNPKKSSYLAGALSIVTAGLVAWCGYGVYSAGSAAGRRAALEQFRTNPIIERGEAVSNIDPTNPNAAGVVIKRLDGSYEGAIMGDDGRTFFTRSGIKKAEPDWNGRAKAYFEDQTRNNPPSETIPRPGYFPSPPKSQPQPEQAPAQPQKPSAGPNLGPSNFSTPPSSTPQSDSYPEANGKTASNSNTSGLERRTFAE